MDKQLSYEANQPYKYNQQEDSRSCVVPPPNVVHSNEKVILQLPTNEHDTTLHHGLYGNPEFIAALARAYDLRAEYEVGNWAYNNRRTAQLILPFMLLGPMSFARDIDQVRDAGITMMVAVRSRRVAETRPAIMDPARFTSAQGIDTATFDVDTPFDIITRRSTILRRINDHLEASIEGKSLEATKPVSGRVLVFCETGNERSPVLPAIYLMTIWGLDAFSAVQIVQSRRFGIGLNPEMITMLQDVQDILNAERQVAAARSSPAADYVISKKRNIDQAYETDSSDETDSAERNGDPRQGIAPFIDGGH